MKNLHFLQRTRTGKAVYVALVITVLVVGVRYQELLQDRGVGGHP